MKKKRTVKKSMYMLGNKVLVRCEKGFVANHFKAISIRFLWLTLSAMFSFYIPSNVFANTNNDIFFVVDTFLCVEYGEGPNMLRRNRANPRFFGTNGEHVYIYQNEDGVLIYDKNGGFVEKKEIMVYKAADIVDIIAYKDKIILVGFYKAYYGDSMLNIIDSITYTPGCYGGQQFSIAGNIYFYHSADSNTLFEFNFVKRVFAIKKYKAIWGIQTDNCLIPPFPGYGRNNNYQLAGASKKVIIAYRKSNYALFNVEKCINQELKDFSYIVNPTTSPWDYFKFINDTTAIFNVRYYYDDVQYSELKGNTKKWYKHWPKDKVERDCVFYRITFLKNKTHIGN